MLTPFRILVVIAVQSLIASADPVGICLHASGPNAPADKIECFEFIKVARAGSDYWFYPRSGQSVVVTAYRYRGTITYQPDLSPTHPDFNKLLKLYEETARATPSTRAFLNPRILAMRSQAEEVAKRTEKVAQLLTITMADGSQLKGCTMTKVEDGFVSIRHADGVKKVNVKDLDAVEKEALNATSEDWSLEEPSVTSKDSAGTFAKIVFKNGLLLKKAQFKEVSDDNLVFVAGGKSVSVPADQFPGDLSVLGEEAVKLLSMAEEESSPAPVLGQSVGDGFQNSLGMKFVPVPIKGGRTDGQSVLFCVWETRMQDYRKFAEETEGVDESWKDPQHISDDSAPVTFVTIQDAMAFCEWLTDKERKQGIISQEAGYRLPTDHEWSCAVGIGIQENWNESPADKDGKIPDVYPWGSEWPVPEKYIKSYLVDEKAYTYPVGKTPPNALGIFDMQGNVSEFCMVEKGTALSRGGGAWPLKSYSKAITTQERLEPEQEKHFKKMFLSSSRFIYKDYDQASGDLFHGSINNNHGCNDAGFRCVLVTKLEVQNDAELENQDFRSVMEFTIREGRLKTKLKNTGEYNDKTGALAVIEAIYETDWSACSPMLLDLANKAKKSVDLYETGEATLDDVIGAVKSLNEVTKALSDKFIKDPVRVREMPKVIDSVTDKLDQEE